jgi:hypothetical protein
MIGIIGNMHECACGALWTWTYSMIYSYRVFQVKQTPFSDHMDRNTDDKSIRVLVIIILSIIVLIILVILIILITKPLYPMAQNIRQDVQRILPRRDLLISDVRRPHARLLQIREFLKERLESVRWIVHVMLGPHWVHDDQSLVGRLFVVLEREAYHVVMVCTAAEDCFLAVFGFAVRATIEKGCRRPGSVHHWRHRYHDSHWLWDNREGYEWEHRVDERCEWVPGLCCGRCDVSWMVGESSCL